MNTGFWKMLPWKMVSLLCTSQVGNPALEYKNKTSSNSRNPSFPLQTSCHLLPNSKYASENTDCLHGLIVFVASEGLVYHSASTFKLYSFSFKYCSVPETSETILYSKMQTCPPQRHFSPAYSKAKAFHDFPHTIISKLLIFISHTLPPKFQALKFYL